MSSVCIIYTNMIYVQMCTVLLTTKTLTVDILETIQNVARETLPIKGAGNSSGRKTTPGWSEHVLPYQEESKFWHSLWDSAGRPNTGDLYQAMKQAKQQYKYAIRRLRRAGDSIQNDKFVNSILKGGVNLFKEIKRFMLEIKSVSLEILKI